MLSLNYVKFSFLIAFIVHFKFFWLCDLGILAGKLSSSNLGEIVELLAQHDFDDSCWQMLGLMLGLKNSVLQGIDANHGGGRPNAQTHALMNTLSRWISQDTEASWGKLIAGLEKCGHMKIATKLR